jgi:transposase
MDNASIHHVDGIMDLITGVGALLIFLPPYSPDYNPIEEAFSKVKTLIKAYEEEMEESHGYDGCGIDSIFTHHKRGLPRMD